jgi:transposase
VDVPPKLSARVRVLSSGNDRKNDGLDALATALAAWRNERLPTVDPEAKAEVLCACFPKGAGTWSPSVPPSVQPPAWAPAGPRSRRGARMLRGIRPQGSSARVRRRLASEILRDVRALERKITDLNAQIEAEVEASGTTLTEIFGIGPILAAKIIGTVGSVVRFPTKAHFASYSSTAPVEASSGKVVRYRLSLAGNRQLNSALHMVAICQALGRSSGAEPTTARRRWRRASPVRKRCGASRGASPTLFSRVSWQIWKGLRAAWLDKEEPRIPFSATPENSVTRSSWNQPSTTLGE